VKQVGSVIRFNAGVIRSSDSFSSYMALSDAILASTRCTWR
jgi:hypothetical protein